MKFHIKTDALNSGGTGLWPVISGVAPEIVRGVNLHKFVRTTNSVILLTKSGGTPDFTGGTPVPPIIIFP